MTTPPEKPALRLGGMALENGLLVHGPGHWAAAIRDEDGTVRVASGAKTGIGATRPLERVPLIRGVAKMAEMLLVLPQRAPRRSPSARLPFERPVAGRGQRRRGASPPPAPAAPAASRPPPSRRSPAPSRSCRRSSPCAPRTSPRYHGAEHKTIGAYESGGAAEDAPKEHDRCGSHLVGPLMAASAIANIAVSRLPRRHQGPARAAASLAAVGVAVEAFAWMNRHAGHPAARVLARPGHELQRVLGTREPAPDQLEVARAALDRLLAAEGATAS